MYNIYIFIYLFIYLFILYIYIYITHIYIYILYICIYMCVYIQCSVGNHIQPPRVPSEVCPQGPNHKLRGAARGP